MRRGRGGPIRVIGAWASLKFPCPRGLFIHTPVHWMVDFLKLSHVFYGFPINAEVFGIILYQPGYNGLFNPEFE
jgi:hypothetical protein